MLSLDMAYWKCNGRKVFVVPQGQYATSLSRKRKREDSLEDTQPKLGKGSSKKMSLCVSVWNFQQV